MLRESMERCVREGLLPGEIEIDPVVEIPREKGRGDYATTIAFLLSKKAKKKPVEIARCLVEHMDALPLCSAVTVAAKGFINFHVADQAFRSELAEILRLGLDPFFSDVGGRKRVIVEFVSANPTGPLHIGHGRGAAVGDALANILGKSGYRVVREYYVNDAGRQIETLGRSVYLRWKELKGEKVDYPSNLYQGGYVREIAARLIGENPEVPGAEDRAVAFMAQFAARLVLAGIKKDLEDFRVFFDDYYSEASLFERGLVDETVRELRERGWLSEEDGALWFKTSRLGDEKDRVIIKSDGEKTYFASDIAYHREKFERGFDIAIDIWGADHHGYIERLKASIEALGANRERLKVILIQFVTLLKDGKPVGMSTRAGQFTTLREVLDEVGSDAARFFFLMRKSDAHLEFDLDLARKTSNENPVYYVQYAHARIQSIFRMAAEQGIDIGDLTARVDRLVLPEETDLIKAVLNFFDVLEGSARSLEPHRIAFYLIDLVGGFHGYYNKARVLGNEADLTMARLALLSVLQKVIREGLSLMGVSAPDRMERAEEAVINSSP